MAYKNGTLAIAQLLSETATHWNIQECDRVRAKSIPKDSEDAQCFDSAFDAFRWVEKVRNLKKGSLSGGEAP